MFNHAGPISDWRTSSATFASDATSNRTAAGTLAFQKQPGEPSDGRCTSLTPAANSSSRTVSDSSTTVSSAC